MHSASEDPKVPPRDSSDDKTHGIPNESDHTRSVMGARWVIVVISIISSTFLYSLDNTIMANIRPGIIKSLGHVEMLPWMTVAYPLGEVGSCSLWGGISQQFNNKWLYLTAVFLFEVGSAISGAAPSISVLIFGRVIAGIGGSGIYVGTVNILTIMTAPMERAQYLGYVGMAWSLGTILGPMIGGAFNDSTATWRWAFYINLCIAAIAAPAWILLIPSESPRPGTDRMEKVIQLDFLGIATFAAGITSIVLVLGFGGTEWEYSSPQMISLYVLIGVIWSAFTCQQWFQWFTGNPILPLHLFSNYEVTIMFLQTTIAISDIVVAIYMLPLFFQFVYGDSTLRSGCFVLAVAAAGIVAAGGGGALLPKLPVYKLANIFIIIGATLLTTISSTSNRGTVCGFAIVNLIGGGLIVQLPFTVAQIKVGAKIVRPVNTLLTTSQMFSVAVSLGVATTLFVNVAVPQLLATLPGSTRHSVYAALEGMSNSTFDGVPDTLRENTLIIVSESIAKVFYFNVAGGVLGFLTALVLRRDRLAL